MDDRTREFVEDLRKRMSLDGLTLSEAVGALRKAFSYWNEPSQDFEQCLADAESFIAQKLDQVEFLKVPTVRTFRENWYSGPSTDASSFWCTFQKELVNSGKLDGGAVTDIDNASTKIISLLDRPGGSTYSTKGLVVGHVQSGKTANMTAVIAKAADAGFQFFIVLTGITEALRIQTQRRLELDLVNLSGKRWFSWTDQSSDFRHSATSGFPATEPRYRQLAVRKKEYAHLGSFDVNA